MFWRTYRVRCKDGSYKLVYKNVDDLYPLHVRDQRSTIEADVKTLEAEGKLKSEELSTVKGLLFRLGTLNGNIIVDLRSAYTVYQSDPCANAAYYRRAVERISEDQRRMNDLRMKIESLIQLAQATQGNAQAEHFASLYSQIVRTLDMPQAARQEIAQLRSAASGWAAGNEG
jgi:hypothetical protein